MPDSSALTIEYAHAAAEIGWSNASVREFLDQRGLSDAEQRALWPRGVRSAARALNALADAEMMRRWAQTPDVRLADMIDARFADNRALKRSVGRLAVSDLVHPIDTLTRTAVTVEQMIALRGGYRARGAFGRWLERRALVLAYSASVLVWLADETPDERKTRAATARLLALIGAR